MVRRQGCIVPGQKIAPVFVKERAAISHVRGQRQE
jgi:hypothetical protein